MNRIFIQHRHNNVYFSSTQLKRDFHRRLKLNNAMVIQKSPNNLSLHEFTEIRNKWGHFSREPELDNPLIELFYEQLKHLQKYPNEVDSQFFGLPDKSLVAVFNPIEGNQIQLEYLFIDPSLLIEPSLHGDIPKKIEELFLAAKLSFLGLEKIIYDRSINEPQEWFPKFKALDACTTHPRILINLTHPLQNLNPT
ncbi:MAG: hypothetical protein SFU25_05845 [Candidatus Caenarcaniphilales bacterium]|nr:hypothetical protein [Candidatus Caenarcaniphilales bacterium]